jgi:hypothetical protein
MGTPPPNAILVDLGVSEPNFEFSGMTHMQAVANLTLDLDWIVRNSMKAQQFCECRERLKTAARTADFLKETIFRDSIRSVYGTMRRSSSVNLVEFRNACSTLRSMWLNDVLRDNSSRYSPRE